MYELDELKVPHKFLDRRSDKLVCFLPNVRTGPPNPYFGRLGWGQKLPDFDVLYLADPFRDANEPQDLFGSWFVGPDGHSILPQIGKILHKFRTRKCYRDVIVYGSSMGGYAALALGLITPNIRSIAECPQIYLDKHPVSRHLLETHCAGLAPKSINTLEELAAQSDQSIGRISIFLSIHDTHHVERHILPFMERLQTLNPLKNMTITFFSNSTYKTGHVAMSFEDAAHTHHLFS
ncbi:MAG: hypothetical protein RQ750_03655 [Roseovarius sp.]|nr:hypothetical protein [Roseovarius sp.]